MTQQIDAYRAGKIAALRSRLPAHRFADVQFLQPRVEGRALRHGAGEEGRTGARHPTRAVGEQQRRNVEAIIAAARTGGAGASDPAILRQRIDQIVHI